MKIKGGLIWLPVGFLAIALGSKFIRGDGTQKTTSADTSPVKEEISKLGESQLGKVFTTGDWTHTNPGKAIDGLLGAGWSNWIMWLAVAILVYWLISKFVLKSTGSGDGLAGGAITVMGFIALAAIILSAVGSNYSQEAQSTIVPVNMRQMGPLEMKPVRMSINDTARVQIGLVEKTPGRPLGDGVTAYGVCAKIVAPSWIPEHKDTPKVHIDFVDFQVGNFTDMVVTEEMKFFLIKKGSDVTTVTANFYLVLTRVGEKPNC